MRRACLICIWVAEKEKKKAQAQKLEAKQKAKKAKVKSDKATTQTKFREHADYAVSLYIRLRDRGKPCCSCRKWWEENFQCGHFVTRGNYATRWDFQNCHGQCPNCNWPLSGNTYLHGKFINETYGAGIADALIAKGNTIVKYTRDDLINIALQCYISIEDNGWEKLLTEYQTSQKQKFFKALDLYRQNTLQKQPKLKR